MKTLNYFDAIDYPSIIKDYPLGNDFTAKYCDMSKDELFAIQNKQFLNIIEFAWKIPFYRRLWSK